MSIKMKSLTKFLQTMAFFHIKFDSYSIALVIMVCAWIVLYLLYLINHDIPSDPGGFYLESARQLAENHFLIPAFVKGFGQIGIPFAFPPLAFYVLATSGQLLGGILEASRYIPGILLLIQSILMYVFTKRWTGSEPASLWAAMIILLTPQIFLRTIFADGITTGLSGIFLLISWIVVISTINGSNTYRKSILGGIFVGLSILSHPAIGMFCSVSFSILYIYRNGVNNKAIKGLLSSGLMAMLIIAPWLYAVISMHGIAPFLAGLKDDKSSISIFGSDLSDYIKFSLSYIYNEHFNESIENRITFILFPFVLAVILNILKGPRILILLLFAGLVTMRGHPSVTMFILAVSLGLFYGCFLMPILNLSDPQTTKQKKNEDAGIVNWKFLAFFSIHLAVLFILCFRNLNIPPFYTGEQETYEWARTNTKKNSTFLIEGSDESLVYFGQRTILLPILGAEWIPDSSYGNEAARNRPIIGEIYQCRDIECLLNVFAKHSLAPDYMIYQISDNSEREWIQILSASSQFDVAFQSGDFVTLRVSSSDSNNSSAAP